MILYSPCLVTQAPPTPFVRVVSAVISYLAPRDPAAAAAVRRRYAALDAFADEPQRYGAAVAQHHHPGCAAAVASARAAVVEACGRLSRPSDPLAERDAAFTAEVNSRCVEDAERYYRAMFVADESSWNGAKGCGPYRDRSRHRCIAAALTQPLPSFLPVCSAGSTL